MSDFPLDAVGIFVPQRQQRLLAGVGQRVVRSRVELAALQSRLRTEEQRQIEQLDSRRQETMKHCRDQRREMLQRWDEVEEGLTTTYEFSTIKIHEELSRLGAMFRRRLREEKATIERKVNARRGAVLQQHENHRNAPGQAMRKEIAQIDHALGPINDDIELARDLTIRRLDQLPDVLPATDDSEAINEPVPHSVREAIDAIGRLERRARQAIAELQTGAASKTVDSFYLPAGVAVFIVIWVLVVFLVRPANLLVWMGASVPVAGMIGFSIYGILLLPLRAMTRRLYPRCERLLTAAEQCADVGRKIATKTARDASAELVQRRDSHLVAADRWHIEQIAEAEKNIAEEQAIARAKLEDQLHAIAKAFSEDFSAIENQMRGSADSLAHTISQTISQTDSTNEEKKNQLAAHQQSQIHHAEHRLVSGIERGLRRIETATTKIQSRFPAWDDVLHSPLSTHADLSCVPVGKAIVAQHVRDLIGTATPTDDADADALKPPSTIDLKIMNAIVPTTLPVVLHRRSQTGLIINAAPSQLEAAIDLAQAVMWRVLTGVAPGHAKMTMIDPIGRGQNFSSFMSMTDHQPDLVGHRVWSGEGQIEDRLAELAHHAEDILQVNLRDRYHNIESYNAIAGSMHEPYRCLTAIGFPENLNRNAYKHLRAIIESSSRCGFFTLLVCDQSRPWPPEMPMPSDRRMLRLSIDGDGRWHIDEPGFEAFPFEPVGSPPAAIRPALVERIGIAAVATSRVEIAFDSIASSTILTNQTDWPTSPKLPTPSSSAKGLDVPLGVQGARRLQSLNLGEGVKQHVLIAGKTGSGKSSLLHTIITAAAAKYTPEELNFYLLDFKKGVEFKIYADANLPHARVIGIESEREFGRSVLQRLDDELQSRGERFRDAGVQELAEFRDRTGDLMPRIMLVIDEFQELFSRDDRLAGDCTVLLDRLVRQGRSFGMHAVLSSQSLAGAQSLPRATLGQMAVRIAMQCSESDAVLILSDENTAARLISRPGEAIYNDAGGLIEGNQPFQVAYLTTARQECWLREIATRDSASVAHLPMTVVFEGNRPSIWSPELVRQSAASVPAGALAALLGEAVEIGPPTTLTLSRDAGRNVLVVAPPDMTVGLLASIAASVAGQPASSGGGAGIWYFDGGGADEDRFADFLTLCNLAAHIIKPRECDPKIAELAEIVETRIATERHDEPPIVVIIDPLDRFRDLRHEESFAFSLEAAAAANSPESLQKILRDGPAVGVFTILVCRSAETVSRWLPRASRHDLQQRILGRINPSDSAALIDTPDASHLSAATMLVYDDRDGSTKKFRVCALPSIVSVREWQTATTS